MDSGHIFLPDQTGTFRSVSVRDFLRQVIAGPYSRCIISAISYKPYILIIICRTSLGCAYGIAHLIFYTRTPFQNAGQYIRHGPCCINIINLLYGHGCGTGFHIIDIIYNNVIICIGYLQNTGRTAELSVIFYGGICRCHFHRGYPIGHSTDGHSRYIIIFHYFLKFHI